MFVNHSPRRRALVAAFGAAFGLSACADAANEPALESDLLLADEGQTPSVHIVPPVTSIVDVTEVVASGSGCPAGTWTAKTVDQAGDSVVSLSYQGYRLRAGAEQPNATANCEVTLKLHSKEDVSLNVRRAISVDGAGGELDFGIAWDGVPAEHESRKGPSGRGTSYGNSDTWTACGAAHELRGSSTFRPFDASLDANVDSESFTIFARRCALITGTEKLVAKVTKVSILGPDCPVPSTVRRDGGGHIWMTRPNVLYVTDKQERHCTLVLDLDVPAGYQFRGPELVWSTRFNHDWRSAKLAATYSYGPTEAQRTEWSFDFDSVVPDFFQSAHRLDLWSPSCGATGAPVQLTVDLKMALEVPPPNPYQPTLDFEFSAAFKNHVASVDLRGIPTQGASEWRRCSDAQP